LKSSQEINVFVKFFAATQLSLMMDQQQKFLPSGNLYSIYLMFGLYGYKPINLMFFIHNAVYCFLVAVAVSAITITLTLLGMILCGFPSLENALQNSLPLSFEYILKYAL